MRNEEFEARFSDLVLRLGAQPDAAERAGRLLVARWAEPHRRYHDLAHLGAVLAGVDELAGDAEDADAARLAAWYHDAVYAGAPDDEQRSADLARRDLGADGLGLPRDLVAEVTRLVLLTATHDPVPEDRNGAVLCDADLAILAAPPDAYRRYAAAVRAEYAHVAEPDFRAGRARVLSTLLDRPALFRTSTGRDRWEAAARANVSGELRALDRT